MRPSHPLLAIAFTPAVFALAACNREVPWRAPLAAQVAGSTMQAGEPLHLASAAGPGAPVLASASLPPATYAADQATQGQQVYQSVCARCHPPGQLDGSQFALAWKDRRIYDLYSLVANTMPQDKPASLTQQQYVDVIAYVLQQNHAAAGAALVPDTASLKKMRIAVAENGGAE